MVKKGQMVNKSNGSILSGEYIVCMSLMTSMTYVTSFVVKKDANNFIGQYGIFKVQRNSFREFLRKASKINQSIFPFGWMGEGTNESLILEFVLTYF